MNLDELKIQLNERAESENISTEFLQSVLRRESASVVGKIKKSLKAEIFISALMILFFIFIGTKYNYWSMRIYAGVFIVCTIISITAMVYLLNKIHRVEKRPLPVNKNLSAIVSIAETYVDYYFKISIAIIPVAILLPVILAYFDDALSSFRMSPEVLSGLIFLVILSSIGIYFLNKWYLNKLYGRYIQQLRSHVLELDSEE